MVTGDDSGLNLDNTTLGTLPSSQIGSDHDRFVAHSASRRIYRIGAILRRSPSHSTPPIRLTPARINPKATLAARACSVGSPNAPKATIAAPSRTPHPAMEIGSIEISKIAGTSRAQPSA